MQVCATITEVRQAVAAARGTGQRIGCVPTMGALHAGHMSLIEETHRQSDFIVVTIFVNPTQFGPGEDLDNYPRPLDDDLAKCRAAGVHLVFTPDVPSLYPEGFATYVDVDRLSTIFEGEHRPGHFRGVATIVLKLFNIVQPDIACFGRKDYQQQSLLRRMVLDLDLPVEIVICPTVREPDGLAMSSRNAYLNDTERRQALSLTQTLQFVRDRIDAGETDMTMLQSQTLERLQSQDGIEAEYAVIADADTLEVLTEPRERMVALVAARVGTTRLIDNMVIECR